MGVPQYRRLVDSMQRWRRVIGSGAGGFFGIEADDMLGTSWSRHAERRDRGPSYSQLTMTVWKSRRVSGCMLLRGMRDGSIKAAVTPCQSYVWIGERSARSSKNLIPKRHARPLYEKPHFQLQPAEGRIDVLLQRGLRNRTSRLGLRGAHPTSCGSGRRRRW